jgi:parvulin-like peptidyl-prolyl isomerase
LNNIYRRDFIDYYADDKIPEYPPNVKRKLLINMIIDKLIAEKITFDSKVDDDKIKETISAYYKGSVSDDVYEKLKKIILLKGYIKESISFDIPEKEIKDYYDSHSDEFFTKESVLVSQLFFKDESVAKKIYKLIRSDHSKFSEYANIYNEEPYKSKNGNMGWMERGELPTALENVVFKMRKGTVSKPTCSDYGYHIFWLKKKVYSKSIPFENAKERIKRKILENKLNLRYDEMIKNLIKDNEIYVDEEYIYK